MRFFLLLLLFTNLLFAKDIVLTKDNTIVLDDEFSGASVSKLIQEAKKLDADLKSGYPMYLFLNTPGGSIQAGVELIEALKGLNRPVHTVTLFAASMGWQLLQHLGDRYVLSYGILMSHKARGQISGEFGGGLSQMDARYGLWLRRIDIMDKQTVKRTGGKKTLKQYRSEYDNELWLNGVEAVEHGYADEVVTVSCGQNLNGTRDTSFNFFGLTVTLQMSECPIVTYPLNVMVNIRTNKGVMNLEDFMKDGGKFGKTCLKKPKPAVVSTYSGSVIEEEQEAELCAIDENLSFEEIEKLKTKTVNEVTQRAQPIYMNFTNSGL